MTPWSADAAWPPSPWRYEGDIEVRPAGRGILLLDAGDADLEETLMNYFEDAPGTPLGGGRHVPGVRITVEVVDDGPRGRAAVDS